MAGNRRAVLTVGDQTFVEINKALSIERGGRALVGLANNRQIGLRRKFRFVTVVFEFSVEQRFNLNERFTRNGLAIECGLSVGHIDNKMVVV